MTKLTKTVKAAALLTPAFALSVVALFPGASVLAATTTNSGIREGLDAAKDGTELETSDLFGSGSVFTNVVNTLLFVIGIISVVMLIIGGIRYSVSGGESGAVTSAKNTIMYAIIGLVIAFLAYAVVNWVLGQVAG